ncbi:MAG: hypothetical protein P1V36_01775 [Planctomycetota bacterium]|nr:hypothetical protein [Planctomycetota bacterium]
MARWATIPEDAPAPVVEVPEPPADGPLTWWAAFLYQTCPGTYQDVADALETTYASANNGARSYCKRHGIKWPVEKIQRRRKVRSADELESLRGVAGYGEE